MIQYIKKLGAGIAVGIANIIPGVSGGTIAVIFGVYSDLIDLAAFNIKKIRQNWKELSFLIGGLGMGVILFARIFKILYQKFPIQTNFFFVGLILGSLFVLADFLKERQPAKKGAFVIKGLWFLTGLVLMLTLYFLQKRFNGAQTAAVITGLSLKNFFMLFFAGLAGAAAMVVPGISGSFVLLILGLYGSIIQAVTDFNIPVLFAVVLGTLTGIAVAGKSMSWLLQKYPKPVYAFIVGLITGSILYVFPQVCQPFKMRIISALCMFAGYALITFFERNKSEKHCSEATDN